MRSLTGLLGLASITQVWGAIGPNTNLFVGNKVVTPNGFSRSAVLAGSDANSLSFPGPLIQGQKDDTFHLNVIDGLTDTTMLTSTTIHWHGFFQRGSSWADGPAGVTQCPIAPGNSFEYVFKAANQAGTFWYHSHHSTQYCDGLRGPMVVYDPADPHKDKYQIDDESTVITLADWYQEPAPTLLFPTFNSTLINGLGRAGFGPASDLAVIKVEHNTRYRFRLVSLSCDPSYKFSIDGHTMTIIEVDSENVQEYEVDQIEIFAGQRYSFVLNANKDIGNYWIRADPNFGTTGFAGGINSAILRYNTAPIAEPTTVSSVSNPMLETSLRPLTNPGAPGVHGRGQADVNINLNVLFNANGDLKFTVGGTTVIPGMAPLTTNSETFNPSLTVPVLLHILSGSKSPQELLPDGSIFLLPRDKVIEISIPSGLVGGPVPHPIHLHGHAFSVIRSAGSTSDNYENPVRRDVVSIGNTAPENVTIRFTTDNPGPWILHCHIDWHLDTGFAIVFGEDIDTVQNETPPPPTAWRDLCP